MAQLLDIDPLLAATLFGVAVYSRWRKRQLLQAIYDKLASIEALLRRYERPK